MSDAGKKQAALRALDEIRDNMVVGLGTGSTAAIFIALLGERVQAGLHIIGIPTSERTAVQARSLGIPLTDFATHPQSDITIDGADAADLKSFTLIKGLGGALLHEKIVAAATKRLIIMMDDSKIGPAFGGIIPIEIVSFGFESTLARLQKFGKVTIRQADTNIFVTDSGNYIADLHLAAISDAKTLHTHIKSMVGVVETGLFVDMTSMIIVGSETGVEVYPRPQCA